MKKHILAVCDLEEAYARNFMQYLNRKRNIPFQIQAFSSVEKLLEAGNREPIEVLLISDKAMTEEVRRLSIGQIMILTEGVHDPRLDQYPSVYKYQSSESVLREVMACYGSQIARPTSLPIVKKPMELIGIYSPLGRVLKTSFALTMGQILARDRAVLYINLEDYSGFEELFQKSYDSGLSDLIYYMNQQQSGLMHKVTGMVESISNLDYLPPAISPMDIRGARYKDWIYLLEELELHSSYETVILDMGDGVDELFRLLDDCHKVYMPVLSDVMSQAKIKQFERLLSMWDTPAVLEKLHRVKPPFHSSFNKGPQYVEQLVWSQLGDYVRQVLREEKE